MRLFQALLAILVLLGTGTGVAAEDALRQLQLDAARSGNVPWGYWGTRPDQYMGWQSHSNRLIPVYTFGITLDALPEALPYASAERIQKLYGRLPEGTVRPEAVYRDQTDIYRLQKAALEAGKRNVIVIVFDGMDWQTTWAAATYRSGAVKYREGRGTGLSFQDYRGPQTDFGFFVTSPAADAADEDVDAQLVLGGLTGQRGGYDPERGGWFPWSVPTHPEYLIGKDRERPHAYTDSASSATSLCAGVKTYNAAINVDAWGTQVEPLGRQLQRERGMSVGIVTSVPISHATPAAAYANNVSRNDYQDLSRDLLGLVSSAHRSEPLRGVDVLLGAGWGENRAEDAGQGLNYVAGNRYLPASEAKAIDVEGGGHYVVAQRTPGQPGRSVLFQAVRRAVAGEQRLFGFFGGPGGHLPFQTADGRYDPAQDSKGTEQYEQADITENPTLAEMTAAALCVLEKNPEGFWLLVEAGDVDWANHANNIDSSVGAVLSGAEAFSIVTKWIEMRDAWDETAVIVTADHGHLFNLVEPEVIAQAGRQRREAAEK